MIYHRMTQFVQSADKNKIYGVLLNMSKKILLLLILYSLLIILAGDSLWAVLFFVSGPVLIYIFIKVLILEMPSNFISRLMYGEKTHKEPLRELSQIHALLLNEKHQEALDSLNNIQGKFLEVEKLKMKILYEKFHLPSDALKIGLEILSIKKLSHAHCETLGNCVEIYIEAGDFDSARRCLRIYGPKLPSQSIIKAKTKRLNALQA